MWNYYTGVFKKYAEFNGRARRAEYWYFILMSVIVQIIINLLAIGVGKAASSTLGVIYGLAAIIPTIALTVRRLHDTNRSGWWIFISLIPILGTIWSLILMCLDSNPGDNKYGPNPKNSNDKI